MSDTDAEPRGAAAILLRRARAASGLTQARLAKQAGTTQSAIAAYEAGDREPTVPVLSRLLSAAGARLILDVAPDPALYRLADAARDIAAVDPTDEPRRLRIVFEFLRGVQDDGHPLNLLIAAEPTSTDDPRFDSLLAAIAEHLSVQHDEAPPAWVHEPNRFLDRAWWVSELPSAKAAALVNAPASFRRRGIMLDRHDLRAA
jgi:transcriptional regulator with XRE-family HTH domain